MIDETLKEEKLGNQSCDEKIDELNAILESISDSIMVWDKDYKCLFANEEATKFIEVSIKDMVGKSINSSFEQLPEIIETFKIWIDKIFSQEKFFKEEKNIVINEKTVFSEFRISPIKNKSGCIFAVSIVQRDISDRKQIEQQLHEINEINLFVQRLIEEKTHFLDCIYNGMNAAIFVLDVTKNEEFVFSGINPLQEKLIGVSGKTIIGKRLEKLAKYIPNVILSDISKKFKKCVSLKRSIEYEEKIIIDEKAGWWLTTLTPLLNKDGDVYRIIGTSNSIDNLKSVEKELINALDKVHKSNEELERFAYIASHDLQEPLRCIANFAQLLEKRYKNKLDDDADEFIDFIVSGATKLQRMIQDLLAFSRIGSTKENFEFISFKKNIKNTLSNIDLFLEENKVIIEYENNFPEVYCNSNQICQVLQNLIINAVKYKKDEKPRINIGYKKDKGQYIFYVKDNGSGIDSKYHEKIFIIFKRLSSYDDKKGTGIGLALCKKVIENHGGEIWVRSKINQGSTFYFTIPFKEK